LVRVVDYVGDELNHIIALGTIDWDAAQVFENGANDGREQTVFAQPIDAHSKAIGGREQIEEIPVAGVRRSDYYHFPAFWQVTFNLPAGEFHHHPAKDMGK
jgi:hypothetical protein